MINTHRFNDHQTVLRTRECVSLLLIVSHLHVPQTITHYMLRCSILPLLIHRRRDLDFFLFLSSNSFLRWPRGGNFLRAQHWNCLFDNKTSAFHSISSFKTSGGGLKSHNAEWNFDLNETWNVNRQRLNFQFKIHSNCAVTTLIDNIFCLHYESLELEMNCVPGIVNEISSEVFFSFHMCARPRRRSRHKHTFN